MLSEPSVELEKISRCETRTKQLRERFEDDYELYRSEKYTIPTKEGKWESFTTNRPSTDANKLINILASAKVKLWIPLADQNEKKRRDLSKTEQFPYGVIALRDSIYQMIPEAMPLQASMSWYAPARGWLAIFCYLYEENKKVVPHIAVWDILNTYWLSGTKGLLWTAYKRFASPEELKDQYGKEFTPNNQGQVTVYNVIDTDQIGTIIGKEYAKKPEEHNCGHVPVLVLPGGSTPFIQSGRHTDTIKDVGEGMYANNRHLFEIESRMGSYLLTLAGRAAKTPLYHYWDSTKSATSPDLNQSPFEKGAEILIDTGKGEKIEGAEIPQLTREFYSFFDYLQGRLSVGGQAPVSFGQINQALPAAGINLLRHASMENIKPSQLLMERAYAWIAQELVSQYKNGHFKKMEVSGIDGSNRRFNFEVKPSDIDDKWNFEAKLIVDLPQDTMANVGMAVQLKEASLMSDQNIRDKYLNIEDTDLEQRILDREKAYKVAEIQMRRVAAALREDGDEEGAAYIMQSIAEMQAMKKTASQPGIPSAVRPSATTTATTPSPPESSGLRRFLSRFGG